MFRAVRGFYGVQAEVTGVHAAGFLVKGDGGDSRVWGSCEDDESWGIG